MVSLDDNSGTSVEMKSRSTKQLAIFDTHDVVDSRPLAAAAAAAAFGADMPSLCSDHDLSDDDLALMMSLRTADRRRFLPMSPLTGDPGSPGLIGLRNYRTGHETPQQSPQASPRASPRTVFNLLNTQIGAPALGLLFGPHSGSKSALTPEQHRYERQKLMAVMVKYIATKIYNSFPPESPKVDSKELPLDKFLLILVLRLRLTLPIFMKGVIYLFRYMDIIYLLRYLNQLNNFANYCAMDFELKQLIVGCFKLAVTRESKLIQLKLEKLGRPLPNPYQHVDWVKVCGLPHATINATVKTIVTRMNGKLMIKNVELVKLRSEMLRFVKMVAKVQD